MQANFSEVARTALKVEEAWYMAIGGITAEC
jgi:hypothetical protein